jgi:ABC-2 type transport system permease protein
LTLAALCAAFVFLHNDGAGLSDRPMTYMEFIWRIVYKGYLRELFVILVLMLGAGGLLRERDHGTAGFTLALPVSRLRLVLWRALVGLCEVVLLSCIPAIVIPVLSPLVGQVYPWSQAWQFSLLWSVGGAFVFILGFLASNIFAGEYTAPIVAFLSLLLYSTLADLPVAERYSLDIHDVMSGAGMPYFRARDAVLIGPLPWLALSLFLIIALGLLGLASRIVQARDF